MDRSERKVYHCARGTKNSGTQAADIPTGTAQPVLSLSYDVRSPNSFRYNVALRSDPYSKPMIGNARPSSKTKVSPAGAGMNAAGVVSIMAHSVKDFVRLVESPLRPDRRVANHVPVVSSSPGNTIVLGPCCRRWPVRCGHLSDCLSGIVTCFDLAYHPARPLSCASGASRWQCRKSGTDYGDGPTDRNSRSYDKAADYEAGEDA